jgi:hypothetical protein
MWSTKSLLSFIGKKRMDGKKSVPDMLRKLRLAGAHPDVIFSIDPEKAKANGDELVKLETILADRELPSHTPQYRSLQEKGELTFTFWLKAPEPKDAGVAFAGKQTPLNPLFKIATTFNPLASDTTLKQRLSYLFEQAKISDDFEISRRGNDDISSSVEEVFSTAGKRFQEHASSTNVLFHRGDKAIDNLRAFGTLAVINDKNNSFLVTMPPDETVPSSYKRQMEGIAGGIYTSMGDIDPDAHMFMNERGLRPFELRMAGTYGATETYVMGFEILDRVYNNHRGKALRGAVCIVLSISGNDNFIAPDGCIVLSFSRMSGWEEFMLTLPQAQWRDCVQKHLDWRMPPSPKLQERRRRLVKVADILGFFACHVECVFGDTEAPWQDGFLLQLMKDEVMIRGAIKKYNIRSDLAKKRGQIYFVKRLVSASSGEEIGYRVTSAGHIFFNASLITTPAILKVLRDNITTVMDNGLQYERVLSGLELLGRDLGVSFSIDEQLKRNRDATMLADLSSFVKIMSDNRGELKGIVNGFTRNLPSGALRGMTWVISEKLTVTPSGLLHIPYNVDLAALRRHLLPATSASSPISPSSQQSRIHHSSPNGHNTVAPKVKPKWSMKMTPGGGTRPTPGTYPSSTKY